MANWFRELDLKSRAIVSGSNPPPCNSIGFVLGSPEFNSLAAFCI